ncbi:anti-sigma factor antagonist (plasmid) [Sphingomonas paeninsulae]|jgi:anti-sigma B factor antagonist|uniref:Anti-sigma factor antagonist n=2 Tax=Sphingomonas paeninsulae TaxID=2319844 RepID=A0A494T5V6_SPHPE|nr:anti-sigma factor antagonist [Sphingomonas paeninsulae]
MHISEDIRGNALVISPVGRLDSNTAITLEAVLPARVQANAATIIDLAEVAYVSSAGLRVLLKGAKTAKSSGHRLVLSGLSESVQEVFDISGFSTIFQIEADVEAALSSIS